MEMEIIGILLIRSVQQYRLRTPSFTFSTVAQDSIMRMLLLKAQEYLCHMKQFQGFMLKTINL